MTDQPKRSRWKRRALIAFVLLLPVLYVLSAGPLLGLHDRGRLPDWGENAVEVFYAPLGWLMFSCEPVGRLIGWYLGLWEP